MLREVLTFADQERVLYAVTNINMSLCFDLYLWMDVVEAGGMEILHTVMKNKDEQIRMIANRAVGKVVKGSSGQASKVLPPGCVATLVELINSDESWKVKNKAMWTIGKIAGDSRSCRERELAAE